MNPTQFRNNKKIIKKYGNRKLYDTEQSSYVVLKDIEKMIRNKVDIQIIDNKTQDDITTSTLTQIIFSLEKRSKHSPPINILKSIIRDGDGSFSSFLVKKGLINKKLETASGRQKHLREQGSYKRDRSKTPSSSTNFKQTNEEELLPHSGRNFSS